MLDFLLNVLATVGAVVLVLGLVSVLFGNRPLRSTDIETAQNRARVLGMRR